MAANLSACSYLGLTTGAAHLIEAFGDDALRSAFKIRMYAGEWTGTMALTEPQAGSSLADVQARAEPTTSKVSASLSISLPRPHRRVLWSSTSMMRIRLSACPRLTSHRYHDLYCSVVLAAALHARFAAQRGSAFSD